MCGKGFRPSYLVIWKDNDTDKEKEIALCETEEQCFKRIQAFIKERNIESYYLRYFSSEDDVITVDYGSWSKFFYIITLKDD